MTRKELENFNALETEIVILRQKVAQEARESLADTVEGSTAEFPYIKHSIRVEGKRESSTLRRLRRLVAKREREYKAALDWIETVEDCLVRQAILLYYMSGKRVTWQWVATQMRRPQDTEAIKQAVSRYLRSL